MSKKDIGLTIRPSAILGREGVGAITESGSLSFVIKPIQYWQELGEADQSFSVPGEILKLLGVHSLRALAPDSNNSWSAINGMRPTAVRFPRSLVCSRCDRLIIEPGSSGNLECVDCRSRGKQSRLFGVNWVTTCHHGHLYDLDWEELAHMDRLRTRREDRIACNSLRHLKLTVRKSWVKSYPSPNPDPKVEDMYTGTVVGCENCGAASDLVELSRDRGNPVECKKLDPWGGDSSAADDHCAWYSLRNSTQIIQPLTKSMLDITSMSSPDEAGAEGGISNPAWWNQAVAWLPFRARLSRVEGAEGPDQARERAIKLAEQLMPRLDSDVSLDEVIMGILQHVRRTPIEVEDDQSVMVPRGASAKEYLYRLEEWKALMQASIEGVANKNFIASARPSGRHNTRSIVSELAAVQRLREIRVPTEYQRMHGTGVKKGSKHKCKNAESCEEPGRIRSIRSTAVDWLPAHEAFGEGIFLQLQPQAVSQILKAPSWSDWAEESIQRVRKSQVLSARSDAAMLMRKEFAVIHTVSHLLIKEIAFFAGYSLPSLRERLFVGDEGGPARGILIYTADGDSEGSLGGLVKLAQRDTIEELIQRAASRAEWCPQDPICRESERSGPNGLNCAVCHGCSIIPETSCAHSNILLNRSMFTGSKDAIGIVASLLKAE